MGEHMTEVSDRLTSANRVVALPGGSPGVLPGVSEPEVDLTATEARRDGPRVIDLPADIGERLFRDYAMPMRDAATVAPRWCRRYTASLLLADAVAALLAAVMALLVFDDQPLLPLATFPVLWLGCLILGRTYEHRFVGNGSEEYRRLFNASVRFAAGAGVLALAFEWTWARGVVAATLPVATSISLIAHYAARQVLHRLRRRGRCQQRVVVVGRERSVAELVRTVRNEPTAGFQVVAACVDRSMSPTIENVPVLGTSQQIVEVLAASRADTIAISSWSDVSQSDLRRLSWNLEGTGVTLLVAPRLTDVAGPRIHIRPVAGLPLLNVEEPEFTGTRRVLKHTMDRTLAVLALVFLAPLFAAVGFAVRLTSRGPVFFLQTRVGEHGRHFTMHKFRSMYVDAEDRLAEVAELNDAARGPLFKAVDDPRITSLGKWLRRFSADELPQLLDVALGRMSLVGPRPPLPREVEQYPDDVRRRLRVKPGITGLWQVSGRSDLSWEESVRLDLHYVENWSLALDIVIILKTLLAVLRRQGAY